MQRYLTATTFRELGLHPSLLDSLQEAGFERCTPIQAEALPLALAGTDVAGQAQTGTGKTLAFLLAIYDRLIRVSADPLRRVNQPRAIVIAPTRELAIQIHKDAMLIDPDQGFRVALVYGGVDYDKQRKSLEDGVDILIGTPGRVIDYFKQHVFDLRTIEVAVLDEADRMFDLGFIKDIRYLFRRMPDPEQRLSMMFSATLSHRVNELAYEHMNNPQAVTIEAEQITADRVIQRLYHVSQDEKIPLLLGLLRQEAPERALIFVNTKRVAEKVSAYLEGNGHDVGLLSGDVPQRKRQALIERIAKGDLRLLVATDVAARGLHIPAVSHVFNYDLPQNAEDYVHRIGRTARAGASGIAISLGCETYVYSLMEIEEFIDQKLPVVQFSEDLLLTPKPPKHRPRKRAPEHHKVSGGGRRRSGSRPRRSG